MHFSGNGIKQSNSNLIVRISAGNCRALLQETLLHTASKNGHHAVVEFLILNGANVNAVDKNGVRFC